MKDATITMQEMLKSGFQRTWKGNSNSLDTVHSFHRMPILNTNLICYFQKMIEAQKVRIGSLLIDLFFRKAVVVPIASKQPADVTAGIMEVPNYQNGSEVQAYLF